MIKKIYLLTLININVIDIKMNKKDIELIFKNFENTKGLPGTKMEYYLQDFKTYIEKLSSYKNISITHLSILPPLENGEGALNFLERYREIKVDSEIRSFYNQVGRIQLRWIHNEHPNYDSEKDRIFSTTPFNSSLIEQEMGDARYINIVHQEDFLQKKPFIHIDFKEEEGLSLFYFNYNHHFFGQMAHHVNLKKKCLEMYTGDDYFADCWPLKVDFPTYMYNLLELDDTTIEDAANA